MHFIFLFMFTFSFLNVSAQNVTNQNQIYEGVIFTQSGKRLYKFTNPIELYDCKEDGEEKYAEFREDRYGDLIIQYYNVSEDYKKRDENKVLILGFYPSYGIIVFNAKREGKDYFVRINETWKKIKLNNELRFYSWDKFLKQVYVNVPKSNFLRQARSNTSQIIQTSYIEDFFNVIKVKNEWIYIELSVDECAPISLPFQTKKGWVKWREGNKLLINIYYICG